MRSCSVRQHLYRAGRLEKYSGTIQSPGIKGKLIRWINLRIDELDELTDYSTRIDGRGIAQCTGISVWIHARPA